MTTLPKASVEARAAVDAAEFLTNSAARVLETELVVPEVADE